MTGIDPALQARAAPRIGRVPGWGLTLGVLSLLTFALSAMSTAVTPALPRMQEELGVATTSIVWVLSANALVTAVTTPIVGRLGDIFGRDRMLTLVVVVAAAGCLVAALAQTLPVLLAGRALQGFGGSIFALAFAVVRDELPAERRATGYGVIGAMWGVGASAGYPLAGVVVDNLSYHWIFWFGLIAIGVCGLCAYLVIPPSPLRSPAPLDWTGALAFSAGGAAVLLAISEGVRWGWTSPGTAALFAGGAAALAAWAWWELRAPAPLVDVRLLRLPGIWTVNVAGFGTAFGMLIMFLLVPKLAQTPVASGYGFGDSVTRSSLYLLPMSVLMLATSMVVGYLAVRIGSRATALAGAVAAFAGFGQLALFHDTGGQVLLASAVIGVGIGLNFSSCANLISIAAPHAQIGEANGISSTIRFAGGAVGAQIAATIVSSFGGERGYTISFAVAAGAAVVVFAALLAIPRG